MALGIPQNGPGNPNYGQDSQGDGYDVGDGYDENYDDSSFDPINGGLDQGVTPQQLGANWAQMDPGQQQTFLASIADPVVLGVLLQLLGPAFMPVLDMMTANTAPGDSSGGPAGLPPTAGLPPLGGGAPVQMLPGSHWSVPPMGNMPDGPPPGGPVSPPLAAPPPGGLPPMPPAAMGSGGPPMPPPKMAPGRPGGAPPGAGLRGIVAGPAPRGPMPPPIRR